MKKASVKELFGFSVNRTLKVTDSDLTEVLSIINEFKIELRSINRTTPDWWDVNLDMLHDDWSGMKTKLIKNGGFILTLGDENDDIYLVRD